MAPNIVPGWPPQRGQRIDQGLFHTYSIGPAAGGPGSGTPGIGNPQMVDPQQRKMLIPPGGGVGGGGGPGPGSGGGLPGGELFGGMGGPLFGGLGHATGAMLPGIGMAQGGVFGGFGRAASGAGADTHSVPAMGMGVFTAPTEIAPGIQVGNPMHAATGLFAGTGQLWYGPRLGKGNFTQDDIDKRVANAANPLTEVAWTPPGTQVFWGPTDDETLAGAGIVILVDTSARGFSGCAALDFIQVKKWSTKYLDANGQMVPFDGRGIGDNADQGGPAIDGPVSRTDPTHRLAADVVGPMDMFPGMPSGATVANVDNPGIQKVPRGDGFGRYFNSGIVRVRYENVVTVWLVCKSPFYPIWFWEFSVVYEQDIDEKGQVANTRPVEPSSGDSTRPPAPAPRSGPATSTNRRGSPLGDLAAALMLGGYR